MMSYLVSKSLIVLQRSMRHFQS